MVIFFDLPTLAGLTYEPVENDNIPFITPEEDDEPVLRGFHVETKRGELLAEGESRFNPNPLEV